MPTKKRLTKKDLSIMHHALLVPTFDIFTVFKPGFSYIYAFRIICRIFSIFVIAFSITRHFTMRF